MSATSGWTSMPPKSLDCLQWKLSVRASPVWSLCRNLSNVTHLWICWDMENAQQQKGTCFATNCMNVKGLTNSQTAHSRRLPMCCGSTDHSSFELFFPLTSHMTKKFGGQEVIAFFGQAWLHFLLGNSFFLPFLSFWTRFPVPHSLFLEENKEAWLRAFSFISCSWGSMTEIWRILNNIEQCWIEKIHQHCWSNCKAISTLFKCFWMFGLKEITQLNNVMVSMRKKTCKPNTLTSLSKKHQSCVAWTSKPTVMFCCCCSLLACRLASNRSQQFDAD